jgi:hypothetical protein
MILCSVVDIVNKVAFVDIVRRLVVDERMSILDINMFN